MSTDQPTPVYLLTERQAKRLFTTPWWAYLPLVLLPVGAVVAALWLNWRAIHG